MKALIFGGIMTIGAIVGFGELVYTKYFAGEHVGDFVLYENGGAADGTIFEVGPEDLPVRINFNVYGWRERSHITPSLRLEVENGLVGEGNAKRFHVGIDENGDTSQMTVRLGGVTLGAGGLYNRAQPSKLFDAATPGVWRVRASPLDEDGYTTHRVEGAVYIKSKAINWTLAGPGLAAFLFGMIAMIAAMKEAEGR